MKRTIITLALATSFLTSPVLAQEKVKSEIVMTQSELKSFLGSLVEAKKKALKKNQNQKENLTSNDRSSFESEMDAFEKQLRRNKEESSRREMHNFYNNRNEKVSNAELLREIQRLNDRLYYVEMNSPKNGRQGSSTTLLTPGSNTYQPNQNGLDNPAVIQELYEAEAKLDSLQRLAAQQDIAASNASYVTELDNINKKLNQLQNKLTTPNVPNNASVDQLRTKFKNFKKTVYFAHDSDAISSNDLSVIKDIANTVDDNDRLNVIVKGFASKVGNPVYNNNLSMRRTQAVKEALVAQGVSIDQVVTIFHGEDFTTTDANARRVDMTIQVVR